MEFGAQDPKTRESVFAYYIKDLEIVKLKWLAEGVSVCTTEILVIIWALEWVEEVREEGSHMLVSPVQKSVGTYQGVQKKLPGAIA